MKRHVNFGQRPDFEKRLDSIGMNYWRLPSFDGLQEVPYWQEHVVYGFSETEVDVIQNATQELHNMSVEMVSEMVRKGDYPSYFKLDSNSIPLIEQSWKRQDKSMYGRFDLAFGQDGSLKMFEYNGDTPVSILECSVAQWDHIQEIPNIPSQDLRIQYNMIDEELLNFWNKQFPQGSLTHFAASAGFRHEDWGNLVYVMDTALRAGLNVKQLVMEDVGLTTDGRFVDLEDKEIFNCFKLYPWEWMTSETFGSSIVSSNTRWLEPAWKMLLSNKAMLVKLWEMFPNHPNLLPSFNSSKTFKSGKFAKKAIHGREGSNIFVSQFCSGEELTSIAPGSHVVPEYDHWGYMYQSWHDVKQLDGFTPIIGSWIIGDKACGMSVREDKDVVTGHNAMFASHIFVPYSLEEEYKDLY